MTQIACTLDAGALTDRLAAIRAVGREALHGHSATDRRAVLRFGPSSATRDRLEAIVAAESDCCAFLAFSLAAEGVEILLTIDAPPGGEPTLADLVMGFTG